MNAIKERRNKEKNKIKHIYILEQGKDTGRCCSQEGLSEKEYKLI